MTHLFLFTIGPVQGFIAQARKTRDLYAGSTILSRLTEIAIESLLNQTDAEVIYPYYKKGQSASMPNKFLAKVTDTRGVELKNIGASVEKSVKEEFRSMASKSMISMKLTIVGAEFESRYNEQLDSHLETYWAWEPILEGGYSKAHERITRTLGAIKNCRPFQQLPAYESGRKCSVSGERDALIFGEGYEYNDKGDSVPTFVDMKNIALSKANDIQIDKGEGLSAVVAMKRFSLNSNASFESTADIAALRFVKQVEATIKLGTESAIKLGNVWQKFKCFDTDGQLLFKDNYDAAYLDRNGYKGLANSLEKIKTAYEDLKKTVKANNINMPSPYYAMLQFDGDKMGPTWSGEYLTDKTQLEEFQKKLALQLREFAKVASSYLDKDARGRTIYAGGDDFSGFVNLASLFEVMSKLRSLYRETVHNPLKVLLKSNIPNDELAFSAGIVIAHYKTPLGEVINTARRTQDIAKNKADRNAFAITLLKRSGEIQQAYLKWGPDFGYIDLIRRITEGLQREEFSNTYIKVLEQELMGLVGRGANADSLTNKFGLTPAIKTEIKRLVLRSTDGQGKKNIRKRLEKTSLSDDALSKAVLEELQRMVEDVTELYEERKTVENFIHWLHIADFIHRQPERN